MFGMFNVAKSRSELLQQPQITGLYSRHLELWVANLICLFSYPITLEQENSGPHDLMILLQSPIFMLPSKLTPPPQRLALLIIGFLKDPQLFSPLSSLRKCS